MSLQISSQEFEKVTQEYTNDLAGMGYDFEWRYKVLLSAIKGYSRILSKETPRNRPGVNSRTARRHKRVMGPSTWFHVKPKEDEEDEKPKEARKKPQRGEEQPVDRRQFEQVMFIQHTENSILKKKLQNMEDTMGF